MEAGKPGIGIISPLAFQGLRREKPPGTTGEQDLLPGLLLLTPPHAPPLGSALALRWWGSGGRRLFFFPSAFANGLPDPKKKK